MKKFASFVLFVLVAAVLVACGDDDSSSNSAKSSSSSSVPKGYVDPSTVVKGTMIDKRDGKTYKTVKIGEQWWMAENLNYAYLQPTDKLDSSSFCFRDSASYCEKYGRLYTWAAAMDSVGTWSANGKGCGHDSEACSPTYPVRGICPEGWHLPSEDEWKRLFTAVGGPSTAGTKLKSTTGWNSGGSGTDAFSFSALPAGYRFNGGSYIYVGYGVHFWSSTEDTSYNAYSMFLSYDVDGAYLGSFSKNYGLSVRCLKD